MNRIESICVVGTGYVGLVTGTCLADVGHRVECMDIDERKIAKLHRFEIPFFEPGLAELVEKNSKAGRLSFTNSLSHALSRCPIVFIAVGTPSRKDGSADLAYVWKAVESIAQTASASTIVVLKSTVPIGTNRMVLEKLRSLNPKVDWHVVSNPEFLREGSAVGDFLRPDRVIVGGDHDGSTERVLALYAPLPGEKFLCDWETAETIKYASNSFLATKISFINFIAQVCEKTGGDVVSVAKGMGLDSRIGKSFLHAGLGYGGSCFPKDVAEFVTMAQHAGVNNDLLKAVESINLAQRELFLAKIERHFGSLKGKRIAIWGIAFKPLTDDLREAPSLTIIPRLVEQGAHVIAFDPEGMANAKNLWPRLALAQSAAEAARSADALVILTEWPEFVHFDLSALKSLLASPVVFDGRNCFEPKRMHELGFDYHCIGRPGNPVSPAAKHSKFHGPQFKPKKTHGENYESHHSRRWICHSTLSIDQGQTQSPPRCRRKAYDRADSGENPRGPGS